MVGTQDTLVQAGVRCEESMPTQASAPHGSSAPTGLPSTCPFNPRCRARLARHGCPAQPRPGLGPWEETAAPAAGSPAPDTAKPWLISETRLQGRPRPGGLADPGWWRDSRPESRDDGLPRRTGSRTCLFHGRRGKRFSRSLPGHVYRPLLQHAEKATPPACARANQAFFSLSQRCGKAQETPVRPPTTLFSQPRPKPLSTQQPQHLYQSKSSAGRRCHLWGQMGVGSSLASPTGEMILRSLPL